VEATPRRPGRFVSAVALITLVCFGGCASTATIARTDGPDNEARIVTSDLGAVYVSARNGQTYRIGRESISSIDHPGNVEVLIGSIVVGLVGLAVFGAYQDGGDRDVIAPVALLYGGPGLALLFTGLYRYMSSVQAAQAFESAEIPAGAPPPPPLAPVWTPVPPPGAAPPPGLPTLPTPPPAGTTPPPAGTTPPPAGTTPPPSPTTTPPQEPEARPDAT